MLMLTSNKPIKVGHLQNLVNQSLFNFALVIVMVKIDLVNVRNIIVEMFNRSKLVNV